MPSHVELPAAPFAAGVKVRAPGNETFGGYVGIIANVRVSARYRRVVFPDHPWQREGDTWAFHVRELKIVEDGR